MSGMRESLNTLLLVVVVVLLAVQLLTRPAAAVPQDQQWLDTVNCSGQTAVRQIQCLPVVIWSGGASIASERCIDNVFAPQDCILVRIKP